MVVIDILGILVFAFIVLSIMPDVFIAWFFGLFHRHTFNPEKWVLEDTIEVWEAGKDHKLDLPCKIFAIYKNACSGCGDIVFRKIQK